MDWKRKLTSRKFWAAVAGFVAMLVVALGKNAETAQTVTGLIMAGASLVAYMIGEGLADSGHTGEQADELVTYKVTSGDTNEVVTVEPYEAGGKEDGES